MKYNNIMQIIVTILFVIASFGMISCKTKDDTTNPEENNPAYQVYTMQNEQLYSLAVTSKDDRRIIAQLVPENPKSDKWPVLTFTLLKNTLMVSGGLIEVEKPVDPNGPNRYFYSKIQKLLDHDSMDIPMMASVKRYFLVNNEGVIKEIIDIPIDIVYLENVVILGNDHDSGSIITFYEKNPKEEIEFLTGFIPGNGYIVIHSKIFATLQRIDIGNEVFTPQLHPVSSVQAILNKLFNINITYRKFLSPIISIKVFKALGEGGNILISDNTSQRKFYIPPHHIVVYSGRFEDEVLPGDNVLEFANKSVW